jgi:predicted aspartyl protease
MTEQGDIAMGRTMVDVVVSNYRDLILFEEGLLAPEKIRRVALRGVVDTAANHLVLPGGVVEALGLPTPTDARIHYADRHTAVRRIAEQAHLQMLGRASVFRAIVEPDRDSALIGAIVLEDLDFLVDCTHQRVYPRDPERIVSEVE